MRAKTFPFDQLKSLSFSNWRKSFKRTYNHVFTTDRSNDFWIYGYGIQGPFLWIRDVRRFFVFSEASQPRANRVVKDKKQNNFILFLVQFSDDNTLMYFQPKWKYWHQNLFKLEEKMIEVWVTRPREVRSMCVTSCSKLEVSMTIFKPQKYENLKFGATLFQCRWLKAEK